MGCACGAREGRIGRGAARRPQRQQCARSAHDRSPRSSQGLTDLGQLGDVGHQSQLPAAGQQQQHQHPRHENLPAAGIRQLPTPTRGRTDGQTWRAMSRVSYAGAPKKPACLPPPPPRSRLLCPPPLPGLPRAHRGRQCPPRWSCSARLETRLAQAATRRPAAQSQTTTATVLPLPCRTPLGLPPSAPCICRLSARVATAQFAASKGWGSWANEGDGSVDGECRGGTGDPAGRLQAAHPSVHPSVPGGRCRSASPPSSALLHSPSPNSSLHLFTRASNTSKWPLRRLPRIWRRARAQARSARQRHPTQGRAVLADANAQPPAGALATSQCTVPIHTPAVPSPAPGVASTPSPKRTGARTLHCNATTSSTHR